MISNEEWDNLRTSKSDTFTLPSQTSEALRRTLQATTCVIEDLLSEDYEFELTSCFRSNRKKIRTISSNEWKSVPRFNEGRHDL